MSTTVPADRQWFGHPRGLSTLFFTEMWERFSYYGMRALLMLFMVKELTIGGLGMTEPKAAAIYGLYTAGVYLLALPGGWIADRLLGQRRTVFLGGCFIAAGHFTMAVPLVPTFYAGLILIVIGTGLLKPNVSVIVGDLYTAGDSRRDAGFSVFYMGINVGAWAGPLVCGWLGEVVNWHLGFAAAGVGMVLGLVQYRLGARFLGTAGLPRVEKESAPGRRREAFRRLLLGIGVLALIGVLLFVLDATGVLPVTIERFARGMGLVIGILAVLYFGWVLLFEKLTAAEKKRVIVIFLFFLAAAVFWSGFEQAGSSMNLFADRLTERHILGRLMPTSWLQSVNSVFIIMFAPVFGWLWFRLGTRQPSMAAKFGYGLVLLAAGFLFLAWGAVYTRGGTVRVGMFWLIVAYLFHTFGELCLSPVGLSGVTKLAPHRLVGQMMGTWFMGTALGNLIAGLVAGNFSTMPLPALFGSVAKFCAVAGAVMFLLSPLVVRLAGSKHGEALETDPEPAARVTVLSKKWLLPEDGAKK